jgi:hypothetical protein
MYERLVRNTEEPPNDRACWAWRRRRDLEGYGQINVYVPGLLGNVTLKAHVLYWLLLNVDPDDIGDADGAYLAYKTFTSSGLQLDHSCCYRRCINPDHLTVVTPRENSRLRDDRRRGATALLPPDSPQLQSLWRRAAP